MGHMKKLLGQWYLVGICGDDFNGGVKGVGKDALAHRLEEQWLERFRPCAAIQERNFADHLKEVCIQTFGAVPESVKGSQEKKEKFSPRIGMSGRELMQKVGQTMKEVDPLVWINVVDKHFQTYRRGIEANGKAVGLYVVADVRFPDEVAWIRKNYGTVVKVRRRNPAGGATGRGDISETALQGIRADYDILNDGSLADLQAGADWLIDRLIEPVPRVYGCREQDAWWE